MSTNEKKHLSLEDKIALAKQKYSEIKIQSPNAKSCSNHAPLVIYTAIIGNYDKAPNWKLKPEWQRAVDEKQLEFVLFTDDVSICAENVSPYQKICYVHNCAGDNVKMARHVKTLPHRYLWMYEASIWIDAHVIIKSKTPQIFLKALKGSLNAPFIHNGANLCYKTHWTRTCPYSEALAIVDGGVDSKASIDRTVDFLRQNHFCETADLDEQNQNLPFAETDILLRRHNERCVVEAMELWHKCIMNFSRRDQMTFNFSLWQTHTNQRKSLLEPKLCWNTFICDDVRGHHYMKDKKQHGKFIEGEKERPKEITVLQMFLQVAPTERKVDVTKEFLHQCALRNTNTLYVDASVDIVSILSGFRCESENSTNIECETVQIEWLTSDEKWSSVTVPRLAVFPYVLGYYDTAPFVKPISKSKKRPYKHVCVSISTHGKTIHNTIDNKAAENFKTCLKSVLQQQALLGFHVMVFDNESVDSFTQSLPTIYPQIKYERSEDQVKSGGLTGTWNRAAEKALTAGCETVVFLNNDVVVDHTFENILKAIDLRGSDQIAMWGPLSDKPGPPKCHPDQEIDGQKHFNISNSHQDVKNSICETSYNINGFAFALNRKTIETVRHSEKCLFNPDFPFGGNEVDYAKRLEAAGGKFLVVQSCFVGHNKQSSWKKKLVKK